MKKIIILLTIIFIFYSCAKDDNPMSPETEYITQTETVTETVYITTTNNIITTNNITNTVVIVITNNIIIPSGAVDFFIYQDEAIYVFRDGTTQLWTNTKAAYADNFRIAISNVLYTLDNNGNITSSEWLNVVPDLMAINGSDKWIIKHITPQESMDAGGMYKWHSDIYKNGTAVNHWSFHQWYTTDFFTSENNTVVYRKENNSYNDIEDMSGVIMFASRNILIKNYDYVNNIADFYFNGNYYNWDWQYNYLDTAKSFIIANNDLYSVKGYVLKQDGTKLEMANKLTNFVQTENGYPQMVTALANRFENGEECIYLLECNSGKIYRYIDSISDLSLYGYLYNGENNSTFGSAVLNSIRILYLNDKIYYKFNNQLWEYDFSQSRIIAGDGIIWF